MVSSMTTNDVQVAVIGAGFSGLGAAIKLKQNGFDDFVVLDRGQNFGGTWRDNTYPGAACDVPSQLYSYSFALNPNWTRSYGHQPEIHQYINDVADKYGIGAKTRWGSEVTHAEWNEDQARWIIDVTRDGKNEQYSAQILVGGVGPLCEPNLPDIDGIDSFGGKIVHSARWDDDYDFTGKRVAVIGTGASAIQLVPEVAKVAGHVDVYQRTAPWIVPRTELGVQARSGRAEGDACRRVRPQRGHRARSHLRPQRPQAGGTGVPHQHLQGHHRS